MSVRITLVGAGSAVFTRKLLGDVLSYPALRDARITLHDVDPERLALARRIVQRLNEATAASAQVEATLDLDTALEGADFVLNTLQVGGEDATAADFAVTARHGISLTIGDTIGVAGIFRGLRTIPVVLNLARRMEALCPNAWLLNYTNPMSMVVLAVGRSTSVPTVGLCHSVDTTVAAVARYLDVPAEEVDFLSGGINHIAFLLKLERAGEDLYPRLREVAARGAIPEDDLVRAELFRRLGYYPTESSEHHAEYSPYFLPHAGAVERFQIPVGEYLRRRKQHLADLEAVRRQLDDGTSWSVQRSGEYAAPVIHARVTGQPAAIVGNVLNTSGLIANLPNDACVEVPCFAGRLGIHPTPIGALPTQCAAMMRSAIDQQDLTVQAVLNQDREAVFHAVMLDPLAQARLDLDGIWRLTEDMFQASRRWLPAWAAGEGSLLAGAAGRGG